MKRDRILSLTVAAGALLAATACSSDGPQTRPTDPPRTTTATPSTQPGGTATPGNPQRPTGPQGFGRANLEFFGDCDALLGYMRDEAGERVTAWGLGGGRYWYGFDEQTAARDTAVPDMAAEAAGPMAGNDSDGGATYSDTNTQEVGVDEGDIVETDGSYVYAVDNERIRIVSVADADVVAELELPQGSQQLLLDGTRLIAITSSWTGASDTIVSLYDVSTPSHSTLLRRSHLEGSVVATRATDGIARLVISTSFDERLPFVAPNRFGFDEDSALAENKAVIANSRVEDWLPRWFDEAGDGSFGSMQQAVACEDVAAPGAFSGLGLTWIASIDTQADGTPVGSAGVVSTGDTAYASTDHLYIATQNWEWQWPDSRPMPVEGDGAAANEPSVDASVESVTAGAAPAPVTSGPVTTDPETTDPSTTSPDTTAVTESVPTTSEPAPTATVPKPLEDYSSPPTFIHQFDLGRGTDATYVASGVVEGRLLNQFAMSEYGGDLRVATTNDNWGSFGDQSDSTVYVLRPSGTDLVQISSIGGLGKGEQIYAVRFIGEVGYVVTFRQIDPLYVIDLSDPTNPVLQGELKIPGYSAYLHPVGDGLLLGVGQDATSQGRTTGTKVSLFDVSDPRNPREIDSVAIGGYSEVEWDHKAFLFWEPDGTIVLPVSPGWNDCDGSDCLAKELTSAGGGAVVLDLDGQTLSARGVIAHKTGQSRGCWNPLQRSIVIGDELVTVGFDQMVFSDRQSLTARDSVHWGDPEDYGCYYWVD